MMRRATAATGGRAGEILSSLVARYPEVADTRHLDELRARDFTRLDRSGHVYLDFTAGGLYGEPQVRRHAELLLHSVLGNPHSINPTSSAATELVDSCRRRVLEFFNAPAEEYALVFTANASHALKLVGESYPFEAGDQFLLTFDNHNSVNGIREFDRAHGARTTYIPSIPPDLRVDETQLDRYLDLAVPGGNNLFAYPAQSNFSGVQHPLEWIERARARGWDVLLDAAAFVPTNRLDLRRWRPDYVVLSFYKMFGYPTGVGALLARWPALRKLHRPWFSGGTITVASVQADSFCAADGSAGFEDGTLNYGSIPAVEIGIDYLEAMGMDAIHTRVTALTGWLIGALLDLRHRNGRPLFRLYGPADTEGRGATLALNFFDPAGGLIDHRLIEELAGRQRISLRTGCFCNPGAGEVALGLSRDELIHCFARCQDRMSYEDFRHCIDGKSTGAVRISLGPVTNAADLTAFLGFAEQFLDAAPTAG